MNDKQKKPLVIYKGIHKVQSKIFSIIKASETSVNIKKRNIDILLSMIIAVLIKLFCRVKSPFAIALVSSLRKPLPIPKSPIFAHCEIEAIVTQSP